MNLSYDSLNLIFSENKKNFSSNLQLRLRRSLSWWKAALDTESEDEKFIFLWISFNAIYSNSNSDNIDPVKKKFFLKSHERSQLDEFFKKIVHVDSHNLLSDFFLKNFTNMLRVFIQNKWVFNQYWEYLNGNLSEEEWKKEFDKQNRIAARSIVEGNIGLFCNILFGRLYILRNQIMHGAATYDGSKNRDQVRDGSKILSNLIPIIIYIMIDNINEDWGCPYYRPILK